jgi:methyl coenzyme M reductase subunit C-like uncharacterized protein (methanogenesis marker protein 7)
MIERNNDTAILREIDLEVFMDDLFKSCKDEKDVELLKKIIISVTEQSADERIEEFRED